MLEGFVKGGEEHRTLRGDHLYHNATYPGRYGFTVIDVNGQPTLTHALPGEYLNRVLLANEIFDDDIRLEGVTRETDGLVILTTQSTVVGAACDREEMVAYFDAHPANFLRDRNGIILPIDAVVLRADDDLAGLLGALLAP